MLAVIIIILLLGWIFGLASGFPNESLVHIFLFAALALMAVNILKGNKSK